MVPRMFRRLPVSWRSFEPKDFFFHTRSPQFQAQHRFPWLAARANARCIVRGNPIHTKETTMKENLLAILNSPQFGALLMLILQMVGTSKVASLDKQGWLWSLVYRFFGVKPPSNPAPTSLINGALVVCLCVSIVGCTSNLAGSYRARNVAGTDGAVQGAAPLSERCVTLSDRERLERALGKGGLVLTGISGLSAIPFETRDERIGVVTATVLVAAATATVALLAEHDTDSFLRECSK
jgi:hypothetical protein